MSKIESAWLDEVGLLSRWHDNMTEPERRKYLGLARKVCDKVELEFGEQAGRSGLRRKYRALRLSGVKVKPYAGWIEEQKEKAVRAVARQQASMARRGIRF
jgi:hypothetical protein